MDKDRLWRKIVVGKFGEKQEAWCSEMAKRRINLFGIF